MFRKLSPRTYIVIFISLAALAIGRNTVDPIAELAMTVCGAFFALPIIFLGYDFR